jgi:hypothetical protein
MLKKITRLINPANEQAPKPEPKFWKTPDRAFKYKVKDGDTWKSLAKIYKIYDPKELVYKNFRTINTNEVNWWLHKWVGCDSSADNGLNWAFSSSANPGFIYIPNWDMAEGRSIEGEVIEGYPGVNWNDKMVEYDDSDFMDSLGKILDIFGAVDLGISVSEISLLASLELGLIILGPLASIVALGVMLGSPHNDALKYHYKENFFNGFSIGLVMAADGASEVYIKIRHMKKYPVFVPVYKEFGEKFQQVHNIGLKLGIKQGQKFNTVDKDMFFRYLASKLNDYDKKQRAKLSEYWNKRPNLNRNEKVEMELIKAMA